MCYNNVTLMFKSGYNMKTATGSQIKLNGIHTEVSGKRVMEVEYVNFDKDFTKVAMSLLVDMYNVGSGKNKANLIIGWILNQAKKYKNIIPATAIKIAAETGVTRQYASEVLKTLENCKFIKREGQVIMLDPDLAFKGTATDRLEIRLTFKDIGEANE